MHVRKLKQDVLKKRDNEGEDQTTLEQTTDIKPMPGYDIGTFPFLIARAKSCISLIDIKNENIYSLIQDKKPDFDNEFLSLVQNSDRSVSIVYSTPLGQVESADMVKQLELSARFIQGLSHLAN